MARGSCSATRSRRNLTGRRPQLLRVQLKMDRATLTVRRHKMARPSSGQMPMLTSQGTSASSSLSRVTYPRTAPTTSRSCARISTQRSFSRSTRCSRTRRTPTKWHDRPPTALEEIADASARTALPLTTTPSSCSRSTHTSCANSTVTASI